jgi:hypothetical protein
MTLQRKENWASALALVVESAHSRPYRLGDWDCLRFTCNCVEALTGVNFWESFAGKYTTRREALRTIAEVAADLGAALTKTLGVVPKPMLSANRGDVVLYRDAAGEHLGICLGAQVAVLEAHGLHYVDLLHPNCIASWSVG